MIPADRLEKLKQMFAEDGSTVTDAEVLEIGLWLLARVQPILQSVPLDRSALFDIMKNEAESIRHRAPFVNLYEWRRRQKK